MKLKKYHLILLALLGAVILSLGWPMHGFPVLLFIGMIPFIFIEDYVSRHRERFGRLSVFYYTFIGFLCWNILTTWWIWNSTEVGSVLAFTLNTLFMSFVFHLYHLTRRRTPIRTGFFVVIFYWVTYEYLHHNWDINWPWLSLGNGFATYIKWIQWYEFTGIFGGSVWILLVNILLYQSLKACFEKNNRRQILQPLIIAVSLIIIPIIISLVMFNNYEEKEWPVEVVVVQPNIDPYSEQFELPPNEVIGINLDLVEQIITPETDFIASPESAIQENIWESSIGYASSLITLKEFTARYPEANYIIGASTYRAYKPGEKLSSAARKFTSSDGYYDAFNTALFINPPGNIKIHHKSKLTPGVEKMPLTWLLKPIESFSINLGGTVGSLGVDKERTVFTSAQDSITIAPVICYESVFGEYVTEYIRKGAQLIIVITNDGWWGNTAGHRQHFTFSQLRAIETRRSVARSANTGISAFINQRGEVFQATKYWEPAVIRQKINANDSITFYVKYGDYIARICLFISILLILITISRKLMRIKK